LATNPDELGALWMRHGSKGEYMTGTIGGVKVVVFPNDRKGNEKAPDWRVLKSKPREDAPVKPFAVDAEDIGF
jgi:hypothetical protein